MSSVAGRTRRPGGGARRSAPAGRSRVRRRRKTRAATAAVRFREGYGEGYREGVQAGLQSFDTAFEGTSIIIPTYNQADLLKQCLDSIMDNTELPYEIIVVDNASTDGTADYLSRLGGQVRYRALETNRGFAGAINVGLMMAKGNTILLLNNDTLVTERWLDNLLACLNSDPRIGMVGPVTNYISGDQQIPVPYRDIREMPAFASEHNRSNPQRWLRTDRLVGFCLLFRRELFRQVGYFDEGFEVGNFEDDDYNIRVRMLGKTLMMAEDTFIHHHGSVSMKALGDRFMQVNDRNQRYFCDKWQNPFETIHRILTLRPEPDYDGTALYPSGVAVQGLGPRSYWIDKGRRRPILGVPSIPVAKLSQIDVLRWPLADPIDAPTVEFLWRTSRGSDGEQGGLVGLPDGAVFALDGGRARKIISPAAMLAWHLNEKPIRPIEPEELAAMAEGLPIIPPPRIVQSL